MQDLTRWHLYTTPIRVVRVALAMVSMTACDCLLLVHADGTELPCHAGMSTDFQYKGVAAPRL